MRHLSCYFNKPVTPEDTLRLYIVAFTFCLGTALSAYTNVDMARRAYTAVPFSEIYANREQRTEMALAIQAYWQDFDNRLPRLSPRELEWLTREQDTTDMARLNRAMQTREFSLWRLAKIADGCTSASARLVIAINTPPQANTEMFHWSKVANCYHESNGLMFSHLRNAGLDTIGDAPAGHTLDHAILSQILLVIIPSSMGGSMGWELIRE